MGKAEVVEKVLLFTTLGGVLVVDAACGERPVVATSTPDNTRPPVSTQTPDMNLSVHDHLMQLCRRKGMTGIVSDSLFLGNGGAQQLDEGTILVVTADEKLAVIPPGVDVGDMFLFRGQDGFTVDMSKKVTKLPGGYRIDFIMPCTNPDERLTPTPTKIPDTDLGANVSRPAEVRVEVTSARRKSERLALRSQARSYSRGRAISTI